MSEFNFLHLDNGITVIHKQVTNSQIAHCGFVLDVGTRDETKDEAGMAHFWEHMAFKGTNKRKAFHIINRLEVIGGELNAYTTKEKIYFYSSVLKNHYERSFELLTDITFNSVFPEKEMQKEKGVILEEMAMYKDTPDDLIFDQFDELIFNNHPLGKNILGTEESVNGFVQEDFIQFAHRNVAKGQVVFLSVANVEFSKVEKLANKYLSQLELPEKPTKNRPSFSYSPQHLIVEKSISQAHVLMGQPALPVTDPDRIPLFMLTHLLGGGSMNSRLNLSLREKRGLVYTAESFYQTYTDTGLLGVYFSTEQKNVKKAQQVVSKELSSLKNNLLGKTQLTNLKEQLCGQLAMAEESNSGIMQLMGKSWLDLGRIESLDEIFDKIKNVEAVKLADLANRFFNEDDFSTLIFKPKDGVS
jgi:predicted Zn-dependent peptidase